MRFLRVPAGTVVALVCVAAGVASPAQGAEPCPNEALRTGLSADLPECRAYEMVTPTYTEGAPSAEILAMSPEGAHVIVQSVGNYGDAGAAPSNEGSTYELSRAEAGWRETGIDLPQSQFPFDLFLGASEDLDATLWRARATSQPIAAQNFFIRDADGALRNLGPTAPPEGTKNEPPGLGQGGSDTELEEIRYSAASRDLSHVLFGRKANESAADEALRPQLWPGDTTVPEAESLYEYTTGGAEDAEPRLVGVKNEGSVVGSQHVNENAEFISQCGTTLADRGAYGDERDAISESGATIFFIAEAATEGEEDKHCNASNEGTGPPVNELYARIDGEKTLKISSPSHSLAQGNGLGAEECDATCEAAAPEAGVFQGASRDGSKVFFLTKQPLLNGDEGATGTEQDLYEDEIEGEGKGAKLARVVQISHDPHAGRPAEVQGVTRISEDGSHVYFVAKGELASNSNGQTAPFSTAHDGAENLYVYEPDPANPGQDKTVFIAMLCSEAGLSGSVSDSECNSSDEQMWNVEGGAPAQVTPDGDFFVFSTATDLTAPEDTSTVGQTFRYDAQTGELTRVSIGQQGSYECPTTGKLENFNCNGNTEVFEAGGPGGAIVPPEPGRPVAVTEDGSVVFQSADGLTPEALNGQQEDVEVEESQRTYFANNIYEYRDGGVSLISDGLDTSATRKESSVRIEGVTPSGTDIFFRTADRLVPQDADTQQDLYDARINGGFPAPVHAPCQEEACQGSPDAAPLFGAPASTTFSGAANIASPPATVPPKPKTAAQIKAEHLVKALKSCKKDKKKAKRTRCEKQARKQFGTAKQVKRATSDRRAK
jgi:hypothetical protein